MEEVGKRSLGALFGGIATFVTAMLSPTETGINASIWSDQHQQKLDELSFKESQGSLSDQEKRDLQELRERYVKYYLRYENPGHHDPLNTGPNYYNPNKSVLPENHYELWLKSVDGGDGNRYTKIGMGKKAIYHRFQNDGNNNWHWNGSTNGKTKYGKSYPIRINTIPNRIKKL
ncbi:hypothetical protein FKX85_16655 [Echinicola soli]|uniref:Uncharacterized protein n=1 Tax=Echinicola soli TaxID=2591634 RepID=A0A514CL93_9BACT|nr:hypothetical protein [Echinicola soli]QDH80582.1 hypothetical protein FKX85_16655 [Echinicola soli]